MIEFWNKIYSHLRTSQYLRNLFTLTSGVGISQLIPLFLLPILTRFFSPEDFGLFAFVMAIIQIIAISSTLRLEMAVVLPKKHKDAALLCLAAILFLSFFTIIFTTLLLLLLFNKSLLFKGFTYSYWVVYFIPLGVFFLGLYNILYSWNNRLELYKKMSYSHITHSLISTPSSILFFLLSFKSIALIIGQIVGRIFACIALCSNLFSTIKQNSQDHIYSQMIALIKQYKKFILYETPHAILNFFSQKYIIIVFTYFFTFSSVGIFDLADKIIGKPLGIISNSFKTVFYKRLTTTKDHITLFAKSISLTIFVSLTLILPLYILPQNIFISFLGDQWNDVGIYIKLICPLFFSRFVFNVVTPTISYTLKNHYLLIWQIIYVVMLLILFAIIQDMQVEQILFIYSVFGALMYACLGLLSYILITKHIKS